MLHRTPASKGAGGDGASLGDFLVKALHGDKSSLVRMKSAMGEGSGSVGGWLVPVEMMEDVLLKLEDHSLIRPHATLVEMGTKVKDVPCIDPSTTGGYPYFGNFQLTWDDVDTTSGTESEPSFAQVSLDARVLSGYAVISNALLADSPMLADFLETMFLRAVAWFSDLAFIGGSGVARPLGMAALGNPALISVTDVAGSTGLKLATMVNSLLPSSFRTAFWLVHPTYWTKVLTRTAAADAVPPNATSNEFGPPYIFGMPAHPCGELAQGAAPVSGSVVVALVDPTTYVIGQRLECEVAFSEHPRYISNQTIMRVVARLDGRPLVRNVITLPDAATAVSPYVALLKP